MSKNKLKATEWRLGLDLLKEKTRYNISSSDKKENLYIPNSSIDEVVIDDWFHLERMDDEFFWIGVGNPKSGDYYHVKIIKDNGVVKVSTENQK